MVTGGCIRNVVLFGNELSIATLLSGRASNYSLNSCPITTPCDFTPCANGAACETQNDTFLRCLCVTRYSGDFCLNSTTTQLPLLTPILTFLLPLFISMLLLIASSAVILICMVVKRCERGQGTYLTREETGITLMQDPQQPNTPIDMFLPPIKPTQEWPV
ncbi:hypothetical protein LOD99_11915 [Oopsacas minuta]|uniref:EGF-like domain-containing protein n=1 Tax=Oopsacas minuta TaxID=111878 RepID=A0AAV7JCA2_9METZ|nr:hypothetical protein LOD99_9533 [Oopsacas minuta]KAI6648106.1 hypothetical protein LOD99_11915 [Oopsacas minuta]